MLTSRTLLSTRSYGRGGKSDSNSKIRCSPANRPRLFSGRPLRHGRRWSSSSRSAEGGGRKTMPPRRRGKSRCCKRNEGRLRWLRFSWLFCFLFPRHGHRSTGALGLTASLPEDVRIKFEECFSNIDFEARASVDHHPEVQGLQRQRLHNKRTLFRRRQA